MSLWEKDTASTTAVPAHAKPQPRAAPGPLDGDPALIGVPTFIVGSIALHVTSPATGGRGLPLGRPAVGG